MIQAVNLIFWMLVIPFCIGFIPAKLLPEERRSPITVFLAGYLLMWAVFEVITIPAVIFIQYDNFIFVKRWFMAAAILCAAFGIILRSLDFNKSGGRSWLGIANYKLSALSTESKIEWLIFFALLFFQLYMAVTRESFDGDDAYYVVQSVMTQQSNAMYKNLPYTGISTPLDARHALAVLPMWIAFVAVQADIHAAIVSHVVIPLLFIPLCYMVYYEISKALFASDKENVPVFMIIISMFQLFGNVSIYTNETFFLTRTWQGKAVVASVVIPMLFLLLLWLYSGKDKDGSENEDNDKDKNKKDTAINKSAGIWFMLVCLNMTAGVCSSLAVFLNAILLAAAAFCLMIVKKDISILLKLGLTCIPNLIYVIIYLGLGG